MTGFNDRKDAFEGKYAHEEKLSFELEAKTAKLFGLWAAEKLGLEGADAQTYAGEVVAANLEEAGFTDIIRKVSMDFEAKGIEISQHMIEVEVDKALTAAQKELAQ
ncbi:MAG: DUF1476 domain-containing protein [Alphaproteobacteria bacterium]|nr:DUF1476 domain-containing protein [Alphaproteobacteria bacterium]MCD8520266.1 DUF1476 domain-containing protein [Alphaproteobacteria bacterium]MCD8525893.1 DUF1476 domain-containing protein [Alphaproteobacteria bacterium]MCD8570024.1 DUF1476 domain-containing protein [Alphaproteobacteria bacterium]